MNGDSPAEEFDRETHKHGAFSNVGSERAERIRGAAAAMKSHEKRRRDVLRRLFPHADEETIEYASLHLFPGRWPE